MGKLDPVYPKMLEMMQSIEVERLLQWAFRSELPKRKSFARGAPSAWGIVERYAALGVRVSGGASSVEFDPTAVPHGDAFIVADEVARLRASVSVDWKLSKDFLLGHLSPLAPEIDLQIDLSEIELVQHHARQGIAPDWCRHPPKANPVIGVNGKPKVRGTRYGKDRYSEGSHCPLSWGAPTVEGVALARAAYTVWWRSLDRLAKSLNGKMKHHIAAPPAAPAAPWR
jgi:hypothetical protein